MAGLAAFVWAAGQAGGDAAKAHGGIDAGIASIICAAIAGAVAVAVALISRPRGDKPDDDHELVKWALEVAMRAQLAVSDGDDDLAEEQRLLGHHLTGELEARRRRGSA